MVRLAATVMLARPAGEVGFEVLMLRRSQESHFAPDAYVFPGGTLDQHDMEEEALERTFGAVAFAAQFRGEPAGAEGEAATPQARERSGLGFAALRELFEEAGVLLVCDAAGNPIAADALRASKPEVHAERVRIGAAQSRFATFLRANGVYANASALTLFSHWITPPHFQKRYDTFFFVAEATSDQAVLADALETHDCRWLAPATALEESRAGRLRIVYPTLKHLERLTQFATTAGLLAFARAKPILTIVPNSPADGEFSIAPELERAW